MIESTAEKNLDVEKLRKQFKDAEFQHRIELGEIKESLDKFKTKEYMWRDFIAIQETNLKDLKAEVGGETKEAEEEKVTEEVLKCKPKKKSRGKSKPDKLSKECRKCGTLHKQSNDSITPKQSHKKKPIRRPKKTNSKINVN